MENVTLTASGGGGTGTSPAITLNPRPAPEIEIFGTGTNQFSLAFDPIASWIMGAPLTGFTDGPNHDGVANGLAWLLNGTAMGNSRARLPLGTNAGGKLMMSFQCLKAGARGTAVLSVQYSNDLGVADAWHTAAVPDSTPSGPSNGVVVTVTPIGNSNYQNITVEIPRTAASAAGKLFGRLQAIPLGNAATPSEI